MAGPGARKWETYEEVARDLLDRFSEEFGMDRFEGKQSVVGTRSKTSWEIDAKGVCDADGAFIVVECRRHTTSTVSQEQAAALAYRILDTEAEGGIYVSPLPLQKGARKIAEAENITHVSLSADSTPHEFCMQFLNRVMVGIQETTAISDSFTAEVVRREPKREEKEK